MKDTIYNLYALIEEGFIRRVGITTHTVSIPDSEKDEYLKAHAEEALARAAIYPVPDTVRSYDMDTDEETHGINYVGYRLFRENGHAMALFEEGFKALNAPMEPHVYFSVVINNTIVEMHG